MSKPKKINSNSQLGKNANFNLKGTKITPRKINGSYRPFLNLVPNSNKIYVKIESKVKKLGKSKDKVEKEVYNFFTEGAIKSFVEAMKKVSPGFELKSKSDLLKNSLSPTLALTVSNVVPSSTLKVIEGYNNSGTVTLVFNSPEDKTEYLKTLISGLKNLEDNIATSTGEDLTFENDIVEKRLTLAGAPLPNFIKIDKDDKRIPNRLSKSNGVFNISSYIDKKDFVIDVTGKKNSYIITNRKKDISISSLLKESTAKVYGNVSREGKELKFFNNATKSTNVLYFDSQVDADDYLQVLVNTNVYKFVIEKA